MFVLDLSRIRMRNGNRITWERGLDGGCSLLFNVREGNVKMSQDVKVTSSIEGFVERKF